LEIDVSNFALGIVLSQLGNDDFLHHVGFYFHKFSPLEINNEIHDKYLLAIINVLKNGVIYLKEFNMKSLCILITITSSSCFKSILSLMDIVFVSILICHHISPWMPKKEA